MRNRGMTAGLVWLATVLLGWAGMLDAATYQLQVASVPERVFMYFVEDRTLPGIKVYLDTRRSRFVLFRDRQPQPLELTGPEQLAPFPADVTFPKPNDPWGITTWNGEAGQLAVFRIRAKQSNYQRLKRVAVQTDGVLTRFPVRSIPVSRLGHMQVPATAESYLTRAMKSGTFASWAERRAASHNGLSVVVGRHHNAQQSDTVYLVVRMPRAGRAYKVILGWENLKREGGYAER